MFKGEASIPMSENPVSKETIVYSFNIGTIPVEQTKTQTKQKQFNSSIATGLGGAVAKSSVNEVVDIGFASRYRLQLASGF